MPPIFQMAEDRNHWIDELARKSPTALAMALERAIASGDLQLERTVLTYLANLGIALVDRSRLVENVTAARRKERKP